MYEFKGFAEIQHLVDNATNTTALIGELSTDSLTYARETKQYTTDKPNLTIREFYSHDNNLRITPPADILTIIKEVTQWVYTRQQVTNANETKQTFLDAYSTQFDSKLSGLACGDILLSIDGAPYPGFVSFKVTDYSVDNYIVLYFSDKVFQALYDSFEIVVVPPFNDIDLFFSPFLEVCASLDKITYIDTLNAIQKSRANAPETILTAEEYNYVNALNSSAMKKTNWSYLVYGPRGNDPDSIRNATINHILTYSKKQISEWKKIFPDIFRITEFTIFPMWSELAISGTVLTEGIYSPIIEPAKAIDYITKNLSELSGDFINQNLQSSVHPYKCLSLLLIGNPDNREGKFKITDIFKDIIYVSSTSADFNRMDNETKNFLTRLAEMIYIAENYNDYTDLGSFYKRTQRGDIVYISVTINNIHYLVSTKYSSPSLN